MNEEYDLSVEEIIDRVRKEKAKRVLIQLPDGLKPAAEELQQRIREALPEVELLFWGASAFGACDVPLAVERCNVDLLLHLGHAPWR